MADLTGRIVPNPEHPDAGLGTDALPWPDLKSPALDAKANAAHAHTVTDVTGLAETLSGLAGEIDDKADAIHAHVIDDVAGLQDDLDGKALAVHGHGISDVTGLSDSLAGKADADDPRLSDTRDPNAHTHAQSDVQGLTDALSAKAPLASPELTGTPTAPTAAATTDNNQIATTAFAKGAAAAAAEGKLSTPITVTELPAEPVANVVYARFADDEDDGHYYWTGSAWRQL